MNLIFTTYSKLCYYVNKYIDRFEIARKIMEVSLIKKNHIKNTTKYSMI